MTQLDPTTPLATALEQHGACSEARAWAASYSTPAAAWDACHRPDWMFWALDKIDYHNDRALRLYACWCVRQVWHLLGDERSRNAVEVAERYAVGEATDAELAATRDAALDATRDAAFDATRAATAFDATRAATMAAAFEPAFAAASAAAWEAAIAAAAFAAAFDAARATQANKLREMIGNPFAPASQD